MQKFSVMLVHLPPLVVQIIVSDQMADLEKERETLESDYQVRVQELERRKVRRNFEGVFNSDTRVKILGSIIIIFFFLMGLL